VHPDGRDKIFERVSAVLAAAVDEEARGAVHQGLPSPIGRDPGHRRARGSRPHVGALLLGYYTDDGKLIYAGRVGTEMPVKVLADLRHRLDQLARKTSSLSAPPPRSTRFGSPLVLSRVHWVEPVLVAEITYLTWTADNLLRHTVYVGLREDKPADQVRREAAVILAGTP
jgi:ATP-dependent DNA ligase